MLPNYILSLYVSVWPVSVCCLTVWYRVCLCLSVVRRYGAVSVCICLLSDSMVPCLSVSVCCLTVWHRVCLYLSVV